MVPTIIMANHHFSLRICLFADATGVTSSQAFDVKKFSSAGIGTPLQSLASATASAAAEKTEEKEKEDEEEGDN